MITEGDEQNPLNFGSNFGDILSIENFLSSTPIYSLFSSLGLLRALIFENFKLGSINIDKRHKFIREYEATSASPHDSQHFEGVLDEDNTGSEIYADSAYRGGKCDELVNAKALRDKRQHRAYRNKPLTGHQERANKARAKVRAHVEHAFASLKNWGKRFQIRSIGLKRATLSIGLGNLIYNMRRLLFLEKSGYLQEKCV